MPLPNLLIVGSQKSGTTWLHQALGRSDQIFASKKKELNFFNQKNFDAPEKIAEYRTHFPAEPLPGVKYYLETTPHYFKLPAISARNIRSLLGSPELIVVLRNPVDRYESAYIHHIMKDRLPYTPVIDEAINDHRMISLGRYAKILERWWEIHPGLKPMLYDDLLADPTSFVGEVMESLGLKSDLSRRHLNFRTNDKNKKARRLNLGWTEMPRLSDQVRQALHEEYDADITRLEGLLGRNLDQWRAR
jgi:hypothetical protein